MEMPGDGSVWFVLPIGVALIATVVSSFALWRLRRLRRIDAEALEMATSHEGFLRSVAEIAGVGGWELDFESHELVWSQQVRHIHEVDNDFVPTLESAVGFYAAEARPVIAEALRRSREYGESWDVELPLITARGRRIWVRAVGRPILDDGRVVRAIGAFQEITEQREEAERRRRKARVDQAVASVQSAFLAHGGPAAFEAALQELIELTGSEAGFVGEILRSADGTCSLAPDGVTAVGLETESLAERFAATIREARLVREDAAAEASLGLPIFAYGDFVAVAGLVGRVDGYEVRIVEPLEPLLGAIGQLVKSQRDRRARIESEQALERERRHLQHIIDGTAAGTWEVDLLTGEVVVNDRWAEIVGYAAGELRPHVDTWASLVHPDDLEIGRQALIRHLRGETEHFEVEVRMRHRDGRWIWVADRGGVLTRDEDGRARIMSGTHLDITERKSRDEALKNALERRRAEAEAASLAKSRFLATMSHEIRTPMNGVLGMAKSLLAGDLGDDEREQVEIIRESGEALLEILDDILDLSKIEAGKMTVEHTDVPLAELLDATAALWEPRAAAKGLGFSIEASAQSDGVVQGDPKRLRQVLFNLVCNAIKFTEAGRVDVVVGPDGDAPNRVRFEIRDTGIGMDAAQRSRIFRAFAQGDDSTTRKFGGTGLGLAISRELVEMMGGAIGVTSVPGEGSTFWFTLPRTAVAAVAGIGHGAGREAAAPDGPPRFSRPLRILAAEDNPVNQIVLRSILRQLECELDVVQNGREAVEAVREKRYDVVLMDVQMPELDGPEATRKIRALDARSSGVPIVALTANAMKGDRERYLAAGMNDYVSKPIDPRALFGALRRCVSEDDRGSD